MNREEALACVKQQLTEHRYIHTIGVMNTAIELAERFELILKAETAAIFHDYAKFRPKEEMKQIIAREKCLRIYWIIIRSCGTPRSALIWSKEKRGFKMKTFLTPSGIIPLGGWHDTFRKSHLRCRLH